MNAALVEKLDVNRQPRSSRVVPSSTLLVGGAPKLKHSVTIGALINK